MGNMSLSCFLHRGELHLLSTGSKESQQNNSFQLFSVIYFLDKMVLFTQRTTAE